MPRKSTTAGGETGLEERTSLVLSDLVRQLKEKAEAREPLLRAEMEVISAAEQLTEEDFSVRINARD